MRRNISAEPEAAERAQASKFTDDLSAETEENDERSSKVDDNDNDNKGSSKRSRFCRRLKSESRYAGRQLLLLFGSKIVFQNTIKKQFWKLQRLSFLATKKHSKC
jgi:hypothetical protein